MPKLTEKQFAELARSMPGASEDQIIAAAKEVERQSYAPQAEPGVWERLNTPLVDVPEFEHEADDSIYTRWAKKAGNFVSGVAEGLTSPMGLASTVVGGGAGIAAKAGLTALSRGAHLAGAALSAPYVATGAVNAAQGVAEGDPVQATVGAVEAGLGTLGVRGGLKSARTALVQDMLRTNKRPYSVLTAANPAGEALDPATNAARNAELVEHLRSRGYDPIPQRGVFGGEPEPSFLVHDLPAEEALALGERYGQHSIISDGVLHRVGDRAAFPNRGLKFNQRANDYYSEVDVPQGRHLKYQFDFPDEAFESPASTTAPDDAALRASEVLPLAPGEGRVPAPAPTTGDRGSSLDASLRSEATMRGASHTSTLGTRPAPVHGVGGVVTQDEVSSARAAMEGTAAPAQDVGTRGSFPSPNGSTALAVAGPSAALGIEDDPNSEWDDVARAALMGAGAVGVAAHFPARLKSKLESVVAPLKKSKAKDKDIAKAVRTTLQDLYPGQKQKVQKYQELWEAAPLPEFGGVDFDLRQPLRKIVKKTKGGFDLSQEARQRLEVAYQVGAEKIDGWGDVAYLAPLVGGDPQMGAVFARFLGATSPSSDTKTNTLRALETFIRVALRGEAPERVMQTLKSPKPRYGAANITSNLERAAEGGRIFSEKVEALAGGEAGFYDDIPLDVWFLRALGARNEKTPSGAIYDVVRQATRKVASEKGEELYPWMAKVWVGMQHIAGRPTPSYKATVQQLDIPMPVTDPRAQEFILSNMDVLQSRIGKNYQPSMFEPETPSLPMPSFDLEAFKREMRQRFAEGKSKTVSPAKRRRPAA